MSDRQQHKSAEVSQLLANVYRCADKSSWYSSVAEAYAQVRPKYPASLLEQMQNRIALAPGQLILEIGAGPGTATRALAQYGAELICLEPSTSACKLAQTSCRGLKNVQFTNQTFEEWQPPERKFASVIAPTSFHWLDPQIRVTKTAVLLEEQGWLVLLWNTPPQPSRPVLQYLEPLYQEYAPQLTSREEPEEHWQNLTKIATTVLDSGHFTNLTTQQKIISVTYDVDDYLLLLTTLSPYIALEASQRQKLISELRQSLLTDGPTLSLTYLSCYHIMQKA